jgi:hypothetical protein
MTKVRSRQGLILVVLATMLLTIAMPATSYAQRRGRDRDRWNDNYWSRNRKCGKFVNCHDARDGRWDGRGARGDRVGNRFWRNRHRSRWHTRTFTVNNNNWRRRVWTHNRRPNGR